MSGNTNGPLTHRINITSGGAPSSMNLIAAIWDRYMPPPRPEPRHNRVFFGGPFHGDIQPISDDTTHQEVIYRAVMPDKDFEYQMATHPSALDLTYSANGVGYLHDRDFKTEVYRHKRRIEFTKLWVKHVVEFYVHEGQT